ncbi:hypothetical protein BC833DRAFT_526547 [Globomyces pollinis-pini]|nr:hypothetical protein BC833DRAFT_526547 [Globomyces pollinis-pini]
MQHEKLKPVFLQHEIESNTSAESDIPSEAAEITSSSSDDEFKPVKDRQQVGELQPRREIDVKLSIKSEVSNSTTQPLPENDIDDISNEYIITLTSVAAFEKEFCPEWFLNHTGKQINKTPQRYMKIRNHILQMWEEIKPKYLSKSRIRPGLKGEGDVNAISRVHTFLESLGAINLNVTGGKKNSRYSEHHVYSEKIVHNSKWEDTGNEGRRRRKIRTANGEWMYELEGQTIEHVDPDVLSARKMLKKNAKYFADEELEKYNIKKPRKREVSDALGGYNPFKLISLRKYDDENPSPFKVNILSNTLIIMDFHSHLATTEIIGLLGGQYNDSTRLLEISDVFPCNSISTGVQCEMDPVSEMNARDHFQAKGLIVVGWYHSHPTFEPNPSIRDIENQANYQALFKRHDSIEPFIGIIVSPFDTKTPVPLSRFQFWYISEEFNSLGEYRLPYSCDKQIIPSSKLTPILYKQLSDLLGTYHDHPSKVNLMDIFRTRFTEMTKLEKMVASLEVHISLNASNGVSFLQQLRTLLMKWADIK